MNTGLTKSLYLGLAALSLGAVATVTATTTSADAASKAKVVSKSALGKDSQNVEITGTNAIYSKPGTVRGAKTVASKATVKKLAVSKHSKDYFRAYYMAVTNRGTVYYKIVSMNGKYRGYIYGGKVKGTIDAGIKKTQTVKEATLPTRTAGFHIKNVKKNTLWTAPQHTTYKAHKINMYGTTKDDTFTVSKAETKTREGSLYYYVTSDKNSDVSGWIFAGEGYKDDKTTEFGGLTVNKAEATATADNSVKIVYREAGKSVGEATWINSAGQTHAGDKVNTGTKNVAGVSLQDYVTQSMPINYAVPNAKTIADAVGTATYGNTVYIETVQAATSKVQLKVDKVDNGAFKVTTPLTAGNSLTAAELTPTLKAEGINALTGKTGTLIGETTLTKIAINFDKAEINGSKVYTSADGKSYYYTFVFEPEQFVSDNRVAQYGTPLTASFKAVLHQGTVKPIVANTGWIA